MVDFYYFFLCQVVIFQPFNFRGTVVLPLPLTFEHWRSGSEALFVCPAANAFRILEFEFTGFY